MPMRTAWTFSLPLSLILSLLPSFVVALSSLASSSRRQWISGAVGVGSTSLIVPLPASAADELPQQLRRYTALAPLGRPTTTSPLEEGSKTRNLPLEEIASRLSNDLTVGAANRGGYFVTGDLSPDLFRDDCTFVDPTNSVSSLSRYRKALTILFEPGRSFVELVEPLTVDDDARTIAGTIRSGGYLQLPWRPRIAPYESRIVYKIDNDGLIEEQSQTWSVSASEALRETFTPSLFPAPSSTLRPSVDEPGDVTKLFDIVNGRRPDSYSRSERAVVSDLIESIAAGRYAWERDLLPGKWMLTYLQPGPTGAGIDRRIPFPELPFNGSYQLFSRDGVTNVGELLGPLLEVRVSGSLNEVDADSVDVPKRFVVGIDGGELCLGSATDAACAPLPISGEGLFDGIYLGERLRIGQNLNGGGARVVQVRIG